jgi:hypothetical protein
MSELRAGRRIGAVEEGTLSDISRCVHLFIV